MTIPSVKTISKIEWLDKVGDPTEIAKRIRGLMDGSIDPLTVEATKQWVKRRYNIPSTIALKMSAINAILECYGREGLFNSGRLDFEYCDTGDTYASTVAYDYTRDKFVITSYGDWVDRNDPNGDKY